MEEEIEGLEKDMTPILLEDLGMRFPTENSNHKRRYGLYQCQYCGKEFEAQVQDIRNKSTQSCGCLYKRGNGTKHSLARHPLYNTWNMMKQRCYNPLISNYINYGGRGIQVCERWLDIGNFIEDMYPSYQEGLTLDRIYVNGNYCIDNCRWTTSSNQSQNTRDIRSTNKSGYRGVSWHRGVGKWAANISIKYKKVHLGYYTTALEAAKAYETYVRLNNLEHNFTPALTEEEIEEINKQKENKC